MIRYIFLFLAISLLTGCASFFHGHQSPEREFRAAWVATVVNIDWPKNSQDTPQKQKDDFIKILDFYKALKYNALIVQVRAAGDAFYASDQAPWSRYLTGKEGEPPKWDNDPLAWMIKSTHDRGMEFHAWLNPYRATFDFKTERLHPTHDYFMHPEWMLPYGSKYYYNPGEPMVRQKFNHIIAELTANYAIDAIHFDDYFYPYKIQGAALQDSVSFRQYRSEGQSLADWRRSNVDSLIKGVQLTIKNTKPWVQFGVSPFGVWRNSSVDPKGSATKAGQTTYDDLYADPLLWMEQDWVDYMAPQAYWSLNLPVASHKVIMDWWGDNNLETPIYMGNGAYKVRNNSDTAWDRKKELPAQIRAARKNKAVKGNILFSAKSLMEKNEDVLTYLKKKIYQRPALLPKTIYRNDGTPMTFDTPKIFKKNDSLYIVPQEPKNVKQLLFYKSGKRPKAQYRIGKLAYLSKILTNADTTAIALKKLPKRRFALSGLDRYNAMYTPIIIDLKNIASQ